MQWSQSTEQTAGTGAAIPHSCAVAPDQTVYCSPGWQLDAFLYQGKDAVELLTEDLGERKGRDKVKAV
jgi:hypothetical protein